MAQYMVCHNECDLILPGLLQGGLPRVALEEERFDNEWLVDALVLCAKEYQPRGDNFPSIDVYRCGYRDSVDPLLVPPEDYLRAIRMGEVVAELVQSGKRTLVTCHMGWNRSGLVTSIAMLNLRPTWSPEQVLHTLRSRRAGAMGNPYFCSILEAYALAQR